jgi:hypothetical protein
MHDGRRRPQLNNLMENLGSRAQHGKGSFRCDFDKDRNAYISCPQSLKRKNSGEIDQLEEITEIDSFNQPQEEIHIEYIDLSRTGESMDHGCTRTMSGTGESISHGRTEDPRRTDDVNSVGAGENLELSLTGHTNTVHKDRKPPDTGEIDCHHHIYTHIAPDEDADKYTEGQNGHCRTLELHNIQALSRDEVVTNRNTR